MNRLRQNPSWNSPRQTDGVMLMAVLMGAAAVMCVGYLDASLTRAAGLAGPCVLVAALAYVWQRASAWSRVALTVSACGIAGAMVVLAGARAEAYLGMFLLGSLLPQYRSWRLVVMAFALLAGVHLIWGAAMPGHPDTSLLLCALALQYTYQAYIAWCIECSESERFEIDFLIRAMGFDGPIRLNLDVLRADSALGQRLKHVQQRMATAIRQVQSSIVGVQGASEVLREGSAELSGRTNSTASGLRDAAMCLEQINVIVQSSAKASLEARTMAAQATELANSGGAQVRQVVASMHDISQASRKITDIIAVIDGIAFQTNILALNAAVEAARAGEQGRGFAVVAAEVRSLALRASESAREIKSLIGASMQAIEAGADQVHRTGATMDDIVLAVRRVGEVFEQLSADSHEHAGGIDVVTQSVKELDHVTQQNIAVAEASSGIAAELMRHAEQMTEVLSAFKLGDVAPAPPTPEVAPTTAPERAPAPAATHATPASNAAPSPATVRGASTPPRQAAAVATTPSRAAGASAASSPHEAAESAGVEFF
jgi:hypothetical protein